MDISLNREEYDLGQLKLEDLNANPFLQFEEWMKIALEKGHPYHNAMTLATANAEGQPTVRTVLLKFFDEKGFVFFTNYSSRKASDIAENAQVAMLFPWLLFQRQVKITGRAERISVAESTKYFLSRSRDRQLGAWTSDQSSVITSRQMLLSKFQEMKDRFKNKEVPLPSFWGGYRVIPDTIEFWQGGTHRLHDRFMYVKEASGSWRIDRLAP